MPVTEPIRSGEQALKGQTCAANVSRDPDMQGAKTLTCPEHAHAKQLAMKRGLVAVPAGYQKGECGVGSPADATLLLLPSETKKKAGPIEALWCKNNLGKRFQQEVYKFKDIIYKMISNCKTIRLHS
eukprot:411300-Pelagomonas_calceolata.AAC.2